MTLGGLIERLGGKLVQGSAETALTGVSSTLQAGPGHLVFAQDAASATEALSSNAVGVVLRPGLLNAYAPEKAIVETPQPRLWFSRAAKALRPVAPLAEVSPSAVLGAASTSTLSSTPCSKSNNATVGDRRYSVSAK